MLSFDVPVRRATLTGKLGTIGKRGPSIYCRIPDGIRHVSYHRSIGDWSARTSGSAGKKGLSRYADDDLCRDVKCAADKIGVTEPRFKKCFVLVSPARIHRPDGDTQ